MGLLERIGLRESKPASDGRETLLQERAALMATAVDLEERLAELELALEDVGWIKLSHEASREFSRDGLRRIAALSRLYFLKNPLVNRAVSLQAMYVWGQGVSISAKHPDVDAVVQKFLDDQKNQAELTSHQARTMKEQDLQVEGNLFFVLFANAFTGRVRVRTLPCDEVDDIVTNPEDRKEPWYYKRSSHSASVDPLGFSIGGAAQRIVYHPDWRYHPQARPDVAPDGNEIRWDEPVYHVKVGGLSDMRFGVPETYSGLDWARAYKEFLEDWATIVRAYSRFAFNLTTKGGKRGLAAAKTKLGTTLGTDAAETNPPPVTGAIFAHPDGSKGLEPIRTAGATTKAEDGRRMLLMVAAATGLPETFFGDVSVGTLATATSLDRPTELKFKDRQTLWAGIFGHLLNYAIDRAATAPLGKISGTWTLNDERDERYVELETDPETGEPIDRHIDIDFPSILEHDKAVDIEAIVQAAPFVNDPKTIARLLLTALGEDDIDDLLDTIFPEDEEPATDAEGKAIPGKTKAQQAEEAFLEAVRELRGALDDARAR